MKPYYQDDAVTIYHGDCREILGGGALPKADLLLTDPPYGMNWLSNRRAIKHLPIANDDALPVDLIELGIASVTRAAYIFCRWDNLIQMPKPKQVLVWVKNNHGSGDLLHSHAPMWEACCFYPRDKHEFLRRTPDVIFADKTANELHPTEKPLALMAKLIECNVGELILDPFMGSGTTLRAAKDLGRKAIGIELEEKYCEIAAKRMAQEVLL